jgi:hypothetical protein
MKLYKIWSMELNRFTGHNFKTEIEALEFLHTLDKRIQYFIIETIN